jgi:hypothetical protein
MELCHFWVSKCLENVIYKKCSILQLRIEYVFIGLFLLSVFKKCSSKKQFLVF